MKEKMVVTSDYIQIISTVIYAGALGVSLISFWQVRRTTRIQTEQQLYMNILSSSYNLWNNETVSKIAKESQEVSGYLALVDSPEEYNNINAIIDFFEFLFRLYNTKMLDKELWNRWKASAKSTMDIPKIKKVWNKTKNMHTHEFVKFIESL
jgi:hypothetical protein